MSTPWIFMGIDRSHFSAKLRPAVRYKQFHCMEYPPNPQMIKARTGVGFVPVLISPEDEYFQDTTDIIDELEVRFPEPPLIPADAVDHAVCRLFELYADEFFPMVSMRTRWAYEENEQELRKAFAAFSNSRDRGNQVADLMSSYLPALGVTEQTIPAIDAHTTDLLARLDKHFERHPFLLGDRISLADCTLMGPLYAHLYLDRVTRKQLYDDAVNVCMWIERCNRPVPESMGEWFNGEYPETLQQVLSLIGADAAPILTDLQTAFDSWAASVDRSTEIPRGTGMYSTTLRGVSVQAGVRSYVPWKIQRLRDAVAGFTESDQAKVQKVFDNIGCSGLLADSAGNTPRMKKDNYQLVWE